MRPRGAAPETAADVARFPLAMLDRLIASRVEDALPFIIRVAVLGLQVVRRRLLTRGADVVVEELEALIRQLDQVDPFNATAELRALLERAVRGSTLH